MSYVLVNLGKSISIVMGWINNFMQDIAFFINFNSSQDETEEERVLRQGLRDSNYQFLGERGSSFGVFARKNDDIIGGVTIEKCSDTFYIKLLWVDESYRQQGIGKKLLSVIDEEASKQNIRKIFVNTYAFQAREFYEKSGYKVIAIIPEYIKGYGRVYLKKNM